MQKIKTGLIASALMLSGVLMGGFLPTGSALGPISSQAAYAANDDDTCPDGQVKTSILFGGGCQSVSDDGTEVYRVLNTVITVLTFGVGTAATIGIVIVGIQYLTAADNAQQVAKAKTRFIQIIIGLVLYAVLWSLLNWLIPGGVLNGQ